VTTAARTPARWTAREVLERSRRALNRRNAGRTMIAVSCVGLVVSLTGIVVGWRLLDQLESDVDESLALSGDALVTLDESLDVADAVIESIAQGLATVEETLTTVDASFGAGTTVLDDAADTTEQLPVSIARIDAALADAAVAAAVVDDALAQIDALPFGVDLDRGNAIGPSLEQLRTELAPIGENLATTSADLRELSSASTRLQSDLRRLRADVAAVNANLARSGDLVDEYRRTAGDALNLAERSRADLGADMTVSRVLLVILGLTLAVGQIVPFWVGRELLLEERDPERAPAALDPDAHRRETAAAPDGLP
jgi:hypothetical protein